MNHEDLVVGLVALNGGQVVGKTRLQKTVFLLKQHGLGSNLEFFYHNYGPFSSELAEAVDCAVSSRRIQAHEQPGYHGVPYSVFETTESPPSRLGALDRDRIEQLLVKLERHSAIELELAATMLFLKNAGYPDSEVDSRVRDLKPSKATEDRLRKAHGLLEALAV